MGREAESGHARRLQYFVCKLSRGALAVAPAPRDVVIMGLCSARVRLIEHFHALVCQSSDVVQQGSVH